MKDELRRPIDAAGETANSEKRKTEPPKLFPNKKEIREAFMVDVS